MSQGLDMAEAARNMARRVSPAAEPATAERREDLIYDIGMNICEDTDFYLKKGFRVVAVEANPAACADAERRYSAEVARGQLTVLNVAISRDARPLLFYVCKDMSAWSTASPRLRDQWIAQGASFEEIEVDGVTTSDILSQHGIPHYAKIDIEGHDLICLEGFLRQKERPDYVSFEVDFYTARQMIDCAVALGYRHFALVGQSTVPQQTQPTVAGEGLAVEYEFARGATGLFGAELPAEWLSAHAVRARCAAVVRQYRAAGMLGRIERLPGLGPAIQGLRQRRLPLAGDWYDIHARF